MDLSRFGNAMEVNRYIDGIEAENAKLRIALDKAEAAEDLRGMCSNLDAQLRAANLQNHELTERLEAARQHLDPLWSRLAVVLEALKHLLKGFITYGERTLEEDLKVRREAEDAVKFGEKPY